MRLIPVAEDRWISEDVVAEVRQEPDPQWTPDKIITQAGNGRIVPNDEPRYLLYIITKRQERIAVSRECSLAASRVLFRSDR